MPEQILSENRLTCITGTAGNCNERVQQITRLKLSQQAKNLLKEIETLRLYPYNDQNGMRISNYNAGATIGYGHLISQTEWSSFQNGISLQEANVLFDHDILPFENVVRNSITVELTQQQFDSLVIFAYNIGETGFRSSSVVRMINNPNYQSSYNSLDAAWRAWNRSQGRVMNGLTNRRNAELQIYNEGVYERW